MHGGKAMAGNTENGGGQRGGRWRIAVWGTAAFLLLLPLVAMQFTDEVNWDETDFTVVGVMLAVACGTCELAARMTGNTAYRAAVGVAIAAAFILVWMNLAVDIIGNEDNPANLMYGGVLAIGIIGALIARFQPHGMARALVATALARRWSRDRADRRIGLHGADLAMEYRDADRVLRRAVAPIGLAVPQSDAGANSRGRSAVG